MQLRITRVLFRTVTSRFLNLLIARHTFTNSLFRIISPGPHWECHGVTNSWDSKLTCMDSYKSPWTWDHMGSINHVSSTDKNDSTLLIIWSSLPIKSKDSPRSTSSPSILPQWATLCRWPWLHGNPEGTKYLEGYLGTFATGFTTIICSYKYNVIHITVQV